MDLLPFGGVAVALALLMHLKVHSGGSDARAYPKSKISHF